VELGYVRVRGGKVVMEIHPTFSPWVATRWEPTLAYLSSYAARNRYWGGEFYLTVYDGFREVSRFVPPESRSYVPWSPAIYPHFVGEHDGFERFLHRHPDPTLYPILPLPVITYARHMGDRGARLIPDAEFLSTQFERFRREVRSGDVPWEMKRKDVVMWRGSRHVDTAVVYPSGVHPREAAVQASSRGEGGSGEGGSGEGGSGEGGSGEGEGGSGRRVSDPLPIDASYRATTIAEQLRYAYLLDLDGCVGAWSGGFWKLLSSSVPVIPLPSVWEHWYSNMLVPGVNCLGVDWGKNGGEIEEGTRKLLNWCAANDGLCREISRRGTSLASKLTSRYSICVYKIR
jgi:uncharacterized membrane protein YgcG